MNIQVISTLTSEDEDLVANALATALSKLLDGLPIAFALRIETSGASVFERTNAERRAMKPLEHRQLSSRDLS